jgi:hypothetical protein
MLEKLIKKGKKKYEPEAGLSSVEIEYKPMEGAKPMKHKPMGIKPTEYKPGIPSQKSKESEMEIEIMLDSAKKKKPEVNATSSEGEDFEVKKTKEGKWAESGAAKERYLKAIGKLGKKKGK